MRGDQPLHQRRRPLVGTARRDRRVRVAAAVVRRRDRLAGSAGRRRRAGAAEWHEVDVAAGRLFVVGDPKQSIYRFRRADITTFLRAKERFGPAGGGAVELTANFRTGEPVIGWVNRTFATLMAEPPEVEL